MLLSLSNIPTTTAGIYALLGYAVVFFGLLLLMLVVALLGKAFTAGKKRKPLPQTPVIPEAPPAAAPGSAGSIKLHGVEPKTAAMLMAIVANKLGKPINELRFISIQEVEK